VVFRDTRSRSALFEVEHLPGVARAEPVRVLPVRLRNANRTRRIGVVGLTPNATLARVIDERLQPIRLPREGIVLNDALASALDVSRGQPISLEVLEGARPTLTVAVSDIVTEYLGLSAYMDLDAVNRLMREGPVISGAYVEVETPAAGRLYARLKTMPGVASVSVSDLARRSFEDTIAAVVSSVTAMFGFFGAAIAFAVIYNNNRIAFAERARELGSLHVLGFSHAEMAQIVLGEMTLLTVVAIPAGIGIGRLIGSLVVTLFSTELARIPLVIAPSTNGKAILITVASAAVSAVTTWRQLLKLDVIGVLKAPE
jgi:putative ABC transport system permease protein